MPIQMKRATRPDVEDEPVLEEAISESLKDDGGARALEEATEAAVKEAEEGRTDADRAEVAKLAAQQIQGYRAALLIALDRLGRGLALRAEKGWEYEPPADWDAPEEEWPPVARLLLLLCRIEDLKARLQRLTWRPDWAEHCDRCSGYERPAWYFSYPCELHVNWGERTRHFAEALYGKERAT